ncbi:MAG TPA: PKD domain-containing protein [Chitinophagaceae bacterium]
MNSIKKIILVLLVFIIGNQAIASHIYGGEMIYEYLGPGTGTNKRYRITLKLFRDNLGGGAALPTEVWIGVFDYQTKAPIPFSSAQSHYIVPRSSGPSGVSVNVSPCVTGNISADYSVAEYSFEVELPDRPQGYIAAYETCCRVNGLANTFHPGTPGGVGGTGSTYATRIYGSGQLPAGVTNSSPRFVTALDLVCHNRPFTWNYGATDPDGDSLVFSFSTGYDKTTATSSANVVPATPLAGGPPDYPLLQFINGYTESQPLGALASIDPRTGVISGIAPPDGKYVVAVLVKEYRNGVLIGEHRKDFILRVQDCEVAAAALKPEYVSCDGFSFTFFNEAPPSPLVNSYYWEFGDGNSASVASPTHTYADTGIYTIKLVINRGQACADSATSRLKVYPGFFPGFTFAGICVNKPTQFTDSTVTAYGFVDSWRWDFGDAATNADTSRLQNPQYTYTQTGAKNVRFIVTSSKGCIDTIFRTVNIIDKPVLTMGFKDTLVCLNDAVQLEASGMGNFSWSPTTNMTNANTATPTVTAGTTTTYVVTLNDNGCINTDSVRVRVVNAVNVTARPDTIICFTDSVQLFATTNGLRYEWTPAGEVSNPNILNPKAEPSVLGDNIYTVTAYLGGCTPATDQVVVRTVAYPTVDAGPGDTICYTASAQLLATTDGTNITWSPQATLTNANTLSPIASPLNTTTYLLTVTNAASGCPKPASDSVTVVVLPDIIPFAGNDTAVVINQTLQLQATGGVRYEWTPATNLSNPNIADPIGLYRGEFDSITYKVLVYNAADCVDSAYVTVKVFKTNPKIFVPTAFTPNGDGRNDVIRPIAVGIDKIEYFRIFNRWGQLVFSTTQNGHGWDGKIKGKEQGTNVYVWIVRGVDFTGKVVTEKGTVTLIR